MSTSNNISNSKGTTSKSAEFMKYFNQTKIDFDTINRSLMNNVESIDSENQRLKEAISELLSDLKEKETSLDQSQKIISKLKEEYTKIIQEYQDLKAYAQGLETENESNKKVVDNMTKSQLQHDKTIKINEGYRLEIDKLRKEIYALKSIKTTKTNELNKKEKESVDKELLITDLKKRSENWVNMVKDREALIADSNSRIEMLTKELSEKDEQLKVMINFSKDINNENKINVKELTKQAVQTIKLLYHNMNSNTKEQLGDNNSRVELINEEPIMKALEEMIHSNKCSMLLDDGLSSVMYIPPDSKSISKEFLIDMNFKSDLIKCELMASIIRETTFVSFLNSVFDKLDLKTTTTTMNEFSNNNNEGKKNILSNASIKEICAKILMLKDNYVRLSKEREGMIKDNKMLANRNNELNLYIQKSKNDFQKKMEMIKKKVEAIEKYYNDKATKAITVALARPVTPIKKQRINECQCQHIDEDTKIKAQLPINKISPSQKSSCKKEYIEEDEDASMKQWKTPTTCRTPTKCNSINTYRQQEPENYHMNNRYEMMNSNRRFTYQLSRCESDRFIIQAQEQMRKITHQEFINGFSNNNRGNDFENSIYNDTDYNRGFYPQSNYVQLNDSFADKHSHLRREENERLKDEVTRLKGEIGSLLSEINQLNARPIQSPVTIQSIPQTSNNNSNNSSDYQYFIEAITELKSHVPIDKFKDVYAYFANFSKEIDKISSNTDEIVNNLSIAENKFSQGDKDKKIKVSLLHNIFSEMNKLISIIINALGRFSNDIKWNTASLKLLFNFLEKNIYSTDSLIQSKFPQALTFANDYQHHHHHHQVHCGNNNSNNQNSHQNSNSSIIPNNIFIELNTKIFSSSELQKLRTMYRNKTIAGIIELFIKHTSDFKKRIEELHVNYESSSAESEHGNCSTTREINSYMSKNYNNSNNQIKHNNSMKNPMSHEEMIQLRTNKKDNGLMLEIIKHFLVVCERTYDIIYTEQKGYVDDDMNKELFAKLYSIFKESIYYKMDYLEDNSIFTRRIVTRLIMMNLMK